MSRSRSGKKARQARAVAAEPTKKDWQEQYQIALREFLLSKGQPMRMEDKGYGGEPEPSYYGWTDFDVVDHFTHYTAPYRQHEGDPCTAFTSKDTKVTEKYYGQFQGTDYSGTDRVAVLVMYPVHCACGKYKDIYWGFEGSMGDVILGVVNG